MWTRACGSGYVLRRLHRYIYDRSEKINQKRMYRNGFTYKLNIHNVVRTGVRNRVKP